MTEEDASSSEWWRAFQKLASRVAHEIKNPLNAVAVNLEVVRSRCERVGVEGAAILPFATTAASEVERVSRLIEALLALARPGTNDLGALSQPVITLYDAVASAEGGSVRMDLAEGGTGIDMPADQARAAVAATLEGMVGPGVAIRVHIARNGDRVFARFSGPRVTPELPADVRLQLEPSGVTLLFPAQPQDTL
jgi:signal transduction histidine kinase